MKICATSDTHGFLPEIPECDIFIHAGDICPVYNHKLEFQGQWINNDLIAWLRNIPCKELYIIPGNHDFYFQSPNFRNQSLYYYLPHNMLIDRGRKSRYDDLKLYGYPWQPWFLDWAFNAPKSEYYASTAQEEVFLNAKLAQIPKDIDILISHGPPYKCGDKTPDGRFVGSKALLEWIIVNQPKLVICGHIHNGFGEYYIGQTKILNVSYVNEDYQPAHPIVEIEL